MTQSTGIQAKHALALSAPARRTRAAGAAVVCLLINLEASAQESIGWGNESRLPFFVTGYAEAYYGVDFNNLDSRKKAPFLVSYTKNDEPALNLGVIKGSYAGNNARVNLAFAAGSYVRANYAIEPEVLRHLYEANVGIKISGKHNLWLDAGIIPSHIGFESAIGKDNWTLTRSMGAENTPYFETGARIGYTSSDEKWFISGLILNGWQHIKPVPGNSLPSFATQITYRPSPRLFLNSSTFIGSDKPDDNRRMRYFHNFYAVLELTDKLVAMAGFDIGFEQKSKDSSAMNMWFNPEAMLRYKPTPKTAIAFRAEYYDDRHGVIITSGTPDGFKTRGLSTNFDYNVTNNILWRVEARTLRSREKVFIRDDGTRTDSSIFVTTSLAVYF
jgi:hypothetical protein